MDEIDHLMRGKSFVPSAFAEKIIRNEYTQYVLQNFHFTIW